MDVLDKYSEETIIGTVVMLLDKNSTVGQLVSARRPLLKVRTDKYVELTKAKEQMRHPKDKDLTDWDRKTMNDAMVAELQSEYDYLVGLEELVKERINFKWL
jgi:hypothetical protein